MYNVACVKWGDKFNADYVNKLYAGVKRNTTLPFNFYCFTENPEGLHPKIIPVELKHPEVPGWWQKLYLFSDDLPDNAPKGRMLFIDLDTLIVGNIDHYIKQNEGFVVLQDLWARKDNVGSAIMSFEVGKHTHIWDTFIKDPDAAIKSLHPHGDQKWVQRQQPQRLYWQNMYPNQIVSFKSHCRNGVPSAAKIICYHGKPSIVESITVTTKVQGFVIKPTPWVEKYWNLEGIDDD